MVVKVPGLQDERALTPIAQCHINSTVSNLSFITEVAMGRAQTPTPNHRINTSPFCFSPHSKVLTNMLMSPLAGEAATMGYDGGRKRGGKDK